MSSSGRRLKSFANSPMILPLRSRWKCLRISPRVLGSDTTTRCSMVPSRLSLFRNAAVAAAKPSSTSRLPSGLVEPVWWREPEPAWAGPGGAAVISTKCTPGFTPILRNRRTVSPSATATVVPIGRIIERPPVQDPAKNADGLRYLHAGTRRRLFNKALTRSSPEHGSPKNGRKNRSGEHGDLGGREVGSAWKLLPGDKE